MFSFFSSKSAYLEDSVLKDIVKHMVPAELLSDIEEDLIRFGDRVAKEVRFVHLCLLIKYIFFVKVTPLFKICLKF